MCLMSDAVMNLHEQAAPPPPVPAGESEPDAEYTGRVITVYLPRRCVYVMRCVQYRAQRLLHPRLTRVPL